MLSLPSVVAELTGVTAGNMGPAGLIVLGVEAPITVLPRYVWRWQCCQCTQSTTSFPINTEACVSCQHLRCYQCPIDRRRVNLAGLCG